MANVKFNRFGKAIAENDMTAVTIKAMFTNGYTPDPDAEVFLSDVSSNRAAGTTDLTVGSFTITQDNTDNRTEFDSANLVTGTISATVDGVVFYIDTTVEATSELLTYNELVVGGTPTTFIVVSGVLTATVDTDGLFSI